MPHVQHDCDPIRGGCEEAVDALLKRHGWELLERGAYLSRTEACLRSGIASDAVRAAKYVYSEALYHACSGAEGEPRREQGYSELFRWLYDVAYYRYHDVAEDATQQALLMTFQSFQRCRRPGTFVMFALTQLRDAARKVRRQEHAGPRSFERAGDEAVAAAERVADDAPSPEALATGRDLRARLDQLRTDFLRKHPRAAAQFAAVWLKFVHDLSDQEISRRLDKPADNVYVLRTRGLKRLGNESGWRDLADDFGIGES